MKYPEGSDDPRAILPGLKWEHTRGQVEHMTSFEAKEAGDRGSENMKKMGINWVTFEGRQMEYKPAEPGEHYKLIVEATWEKVKQNPDVKAALLSTGNLVLKPDHHQEADAPAAWKYFDILTDIRRQLRGARGNVEVKTADQTPLASTGVAPRKQSRRWIKWLTSSAMLCLAAWLGSSYCVAYRYTHRAQPIVDETIPAIAWGHIDPLRLTTSDGEQLGAWFIAGRAEQPVVLFLHGNGACRSTSLAPAELAASAGCAVLTVTLRAHGDSTGELNDFGFSARHDVVAAVDWIEKNQPGHRIVVFGQSLGAAAAIFAAKQLGTRVSGYILESPFRDVRSAVWRRLQLRLPWGLDWVAYAGLSTVSPWVIPNLDRISPLAAIDTIPSSVPVLILAGSADRRVPLDETRAIANRISTHARLVAIAGDHLQLDQADPATYRSAVFDLITSFDSNSP